MINLWEFSDCLEIVWRLFGEYWEIFCRNAQRDVRRARPGDEFNIPPINWNKKRRMIQVSRSRVTYDSVSPMIIWCYEAEEFLLRCLSHDLLDATSTCNYTALPQSEQTNENNEQEERISPRIEIWNCFQKIVKRRVKPNKWTNEARGENNVKGNLICLINNFQFHQSATKVNSPNQPQGLERFVGFFQFPFHLFIPLSFFSLSFFISLFLSPIPSPHFPSCCLFAHRFCHHLIDRCGWSHPPFIIAG